MHSGYRKSTRSSASSCVDYSGAGLVYQRRLSEVAAGSASSVQALASGLQHLSGSHTSSHGDENPPEAPGSWVGYPEP